MAGRGSWMSLVVAAAATALWLLADPRAETAPGTSSSSAPLRRESREAASRGPGSGADERPTPAPRGDASAEAARPGEVREMPGASAEAQPDSPLSAAERA